MMENAITAKSRRRAFVAAFSLTAVLLVIVQVKVNNPMILMERFVPGSGWLMIALLAGYAGLLAYKMADPEKSKALRPKIWLLFSIVFFAQLLLGLAGIEKMLMTGKLHFPIPALIAAGPIYRGSGLFMIILFSVTILLVGPAWCSYLCYIGSWDDQTARMRKKPKPLPWWQELLRIGILVVVFLAAYLLGRSEKGAGAAFALASAFGIGGLLVMLIFSRKTGTMVHCTTWCPMGFLATRLGKISPFRIRIDSKCDRCLRCTTACRYDALSKELIEKNRVGASCTLCGDCVSHCENNHIDYKFLGLSGQSARNVFIVLVVSLHAVFLGVARI